MAEPPIIQTTTDELYLPTRLVYSVRQSDVLRRWFDRHPTMDWDPGAGRWTWNYHPLLRRLGLPGIYADLVRRQGGLVMASCYLVDKNTLHVYVRSIARALYFLRFFDREVPHKTAKGEFVDGYNLVTTAKTLAAIPPPEQFFTDESKIRFIDFASMMEKCEKPSDYKAMKAMLTNEMDNDRIVPLERHRLEMFYTDGPEALQTAMQFREMFAILQHNSPTPIKPSEVILDQFMNENPESS